MSRIVLFTILSLLCIRTFSQEAMSFKYADSLTYQLYQEGRWSELAEKGKEAIAEGHDYYYMRMRMGIAYYKRQNYGLAAHHFNKAMEFNENDQIALEYLFYSYYLSGRYFQAWAALSDLSPAIRERVKNESRIKKNSVTAEVFYSNANTENITKDPDTYFTNPEAGSQIVTKYFINNQIYFSHITGRRSSYFHSLANLIKDNYLHYYDGLYKADMPLQRVMQFQYYGRLNLFSGSGWTVSPSIHFLTAGYPLISISYQGMNISATTYDIRSNGFAGGVGITKTGGFFTLAGEAVYTNLNYAGNIQGAVSLTLYPAGNRTIYIGGNIAGLSQIEPSGAGMRLIFGAIAGFSIKDKVWFEFSGTSGNMKNYSENNGLVIYSSADYLTGKYGGRIIVPFYKKGITIFAGGGEAFYSSEFIPADGINNSGNNKLDYSNYNITGGITWNF